MTKTWTVVTSWKLQANVEVEAETLEEAMAELEESDKIPDGTYVDDSFRVDEDMTYSVNADGTELIGS